MTGTAPFPILRVYTGVPPDERIERRFTGPFKIGRAEDCGLRIQNEFVSRYQAEVVFSEGQWWIRDLGSSNGLYLGDHRIQQLVVAGSVTIRLGIYGPPVTFEAVPQPLAPLDPSSSTPVQPIAPQPVTAQSAPPPAAPRPLSQASPADMNAYVAKYFEGPQNDATVGDHTRMVRRAFQQVQTKQKRKYGVLLSIFGLAILGVAGFAYYQHRQMQQQAAIAKDLFYSMKALDVDIANVEKLVLETNNAQAVEQVKRYQVRRREMERNYNHFLSALRVYDRKMSEDDRLILRMARIFGECEMNTPPEFVKEVKNYIQKWQGSPRLANALEIGTKNGYIRRISRELLAQNLPPQFLYLAIQESDLNPHISGPPTYKGIAKGMWQFIPETGAKYGLRIGPLAEFRRPDPADDRHDWEKATHAASLYIKDIYRTDAQASGLLVMASYNWGEHRVIKLIQSMPANPRERNFWRLLRDHRDKIPQETYDYVFYIFSGAVIGEDPKRFGFKFENPLAHLESQ